MKKGEQTYKETQLTLPDGLIADLDSFLQVSVQGNAIDLFTEQSGMDGKSSFAHFRSTDGGMSWREQDIGWLVERLAKCAKLEFQGQPWLAAGKSGEVYALFNDGGEVDLPKLGYTYYKGKLVRYQDGVTQELMTLDDPSFTYYDTLGESLGSGTELVLGTWGQSDSVTDITGEKPQDYILVYDPMTGTLRSKAPNQSENGMPPLGYSKGKLFMGGNNEIVVADAATCRITQRIPMLDDREDKAFAGTYTSGPDGAFYALTKSGVYRLVPGAQAWEQLLDGSVCKLGTAGSNDTDCRSLKVGEDGSICILLRHTRSSDFRPEPKGMTLYRYTPV